MTQPRWYPRHRRITIPTPAAGADFSRVNDSGGTWIVRHVVFQLVNDANVANRFVALTATAGEDVWFRTCAQLAQTAGMDRLHSAFPGAPLTTADVPTWVLAWPHDGLWLPPGHVLASAVANIQAGDQLSAIVMQVIELPETLPASLSPMLTTFVEEEGA